jgi:hypothetical protein
VAHSWLEQKRRIVLVLCRLGLGFRSLVLCGRRGWIVDSQAGGNPNDLTALAEQEQARELSTGR